MEYLLYAILIYILSEFVFGLLSDNNDFCDLVAVVIRGIMYSFCISCLIIWIKKTSCAIHGFFDYSLTFSLFGCLLLFITILLLSTFFFLRKTKWYTLVAYCKLYSKILALFSSLYIFTYSGLCLLVADLSFSSITKLAVIFVISWLYFFIISTLWRQSNGVFIMKTYPDILYLRSFNSDKDKHQKQIEESLVKVCNNLNLRICKIANPIRFNSNVREFCLPVSNWKNELNFYIARAKYIFCIIDITEGVLWEMFEHQKFINKYIYCIRNKKTLQEILTNKIFRKYDNSKLMISLKTISKSNYNGTTFLRIDSSECFYSLSLKAILTNYKDNPKTSSFTVDYSYSEQIETANYKRRDLLQRFERSLVAFSNGLAKIPVFFIIQFMVLFFTKWCFSKNGYIYFLSLLKHIVIFEKDLLLQGIFLNVSVDISDFINEALTFSSIFLAIICIPIIIIHKFFHELYYTNVTKEIICNTLTFNIRTILMLMIAFLLVLSAYNTINIINGDISNPNNWGKLLLLSFSIGWVQSYRDNFSYNTFQTRKLFLKNKVMFNIHSHFIRILHEIKY